MANTFVATQFLRMAMSHPIEDCMTFAQLNARIDEMEATTPHDELPPIYDRFVAAKNELMRVSA